MDLRATFTRVPSLTALAALREQYLDSLAHAQDALIELLVHDAAYYRIDADGEAVGHCIVHGGDRLVEYYVTLAYEAFAHELLPRFITEHNIASALVKSFDHVFLSCALDFQKSVKVTGALVRHYVRRELPDLLGNRYTQRTAQLGDLPRILAVQQAVFTHPERLRGVVERGHMRLFERGADLIGFGIIRPIIRGRPDVEIGIAVDAPYRQHGYAMHMLQDMVEHCLAEGLTPVSGCARDNEASIRTGLRIGYLSRYRIVEVRFQ